MNENIPNTTEDQKLSTHTARKKSVSLTTPTKPDRIRTELNIEKWPAIWNPTHSKTRSKLRAMPRTLERESTAPDGTKILSQVAINPIAHLGDLTTDDQRTLYALIKHWENRGKPAHETPFSIRQLSRLLHKKGWGTNVIDAVTGSLERLRGTMLVWTRSYRSKDERVENLETVYINILTKLKIIRRKVDGHVTTEAGYFQFDDHMLKNLLENYTKPFLFDVFMDIRGEIALKLYSYLDLIMADKVRFERCTRELFEDIGLTGPAYRNPSKRKQNLEKALAELTGKMLTTGMLKSATIERTRDGKDFKAVFQKTTRSELLVEEAEPATKFVTASAVVINHYSKPKDPQTLQAEELVRYFHQSFHGIAAHSPQSKETAQALALVTQYGLEKSQRIIEFAREQATSTHYQIQHFGAILSYVSRAVAELDRQERRMPLPAARPSVVQPARQQYLRGESRLVALPQEAYDLRFEKTKLLVLQENRFLASHQDRAGSILSQMVRSRMIRDLEQEPMELMPTDYMPEWLRRLAQNLPL